MTKFDPDTCHKIIQALEAGNYRKTAAALAGIDESTFHLWMKKGRESKTKRGKHFEFYQSVKKAEEKAKAYHLQQIRKASENGSWQASAWYLERKHPSEWGRQQRIEMDSTVKSTTDVKIVSEDVNDLSSELRADITEVLSRVRREREVKSGESGVE